VRRISPQLALLLLTGCLGCAAPLRSPALAAPAQQQDAPGQTEDPDQQEENAPWYEGALQLDEGHERVSKRVASSAEWLDSFFGNQRSVAENNQSEIRVRLDASVEDGEGFEFKTKFKAQVVLPETEKRFLLFLSANPDEDPGIEDEFIEEVRDEISGEDEENLTLGAQYYLVDTLRRNVKLDAGVRWSDGAPVLNLGVRYRHLFNIGSWLMRFTERLRWYSDDGLDSRTLLDFDRSITETLFFRSTTSLSWFEEEDGIFYSQSFLVSQILQDEKVLIYQWINSFSSHPSNTLEEVKLKLRYRQRFLRDWMFLELAPEVSWPEDKDYEPVAAFLVRLELLFGRRIRKL